VTPYPQTTSLEREILKHYYMHAGYGEDHVPWKGCSSKWLPLDHQVIARFTNLGLLIQEPGPSSTTRTVANRDALAVYFNALDCVPLPVRVWKIPEFQA
jgi:hypothetical protein